MPPRSNGLLTGITTIGRGSEVVERLALASSRRPVERGKQVVQLNVERFAELEPSVDGATGITGFELNQTAASHT